MSEPSATHRHAASTDEDWRITSHEDATLACARIVSNMEALLQLIEAESSLLRAGKTIAASAIEQRKSEYARAHMDDLEFLRQVGPELEYWAPNAVERLRSAHAEFMSVLQINMAALATAQVAQESAERSTAAGLEHYVPPAPSLARRMALRAPGRSLFRRLAKAV
ncbi:hypothetical protein OSH11_20250 [Kaistia dalseonensis]|uniref:Flagellar protein FlgN n=1 Tax=Kaistia dalseonensis TaxID=410840 RepID=A0ABU0HBJ4_9HYPH|nr:hypothetical protein [Kaistia dalseonensis]MCX5497048.1 hypothetical protein [Kaistia dalseonensis]MDQ0439674.1 hypothetical protein [Kaistia dalseonensis]